MLFKNGLSLCAEHFIIRIYHSKHIGLQKNFHLRRNVIYKRLDASDSTE